MNKILLVAIAVAGVLAGCSSEEPKLGKQQDKEMRDAFHRKPDINTLSPERRKMVEGMMAASQGGKTGAPPSIPAKP